MKAIRVKDGLFSLAKIKELLSTIFDLRGLKLQDKELYHEALEIHTQKKIFLANAFNNAFAIKNGIKEVYSYDIVFEKSDQIERVIPE